MVAALFRSFSIGEGRTTVGGETQTSAGRGPALGGVGDARDCVVVAGAGFEPATFGL